MCDMNSMTQMLITQMIKAEGTIGIAYHIIPWMSQIKIQVRRHDYQNDAKEDYNVWGAGVAMDFKWGWQ